MITANAGKDEENLDPDHEYIPGGNGKWSGHSEHGLAVFPKELNRQLPYDPVVAFLDLYSREMKTCSHQPILECLGQRFQ